MKLVAEAAFALLRRKAEIIPSLFSGFLFSLFSNL